MADGDEGKKKRESHSNSGWNETCIGIWTRSTKEKGVAEEDRGRICNGISVVKLRKGVDPKKVKLSRTRGLQVVVQEVEQPRQASNRTDPSQDATNPDSSAQPKEVNDGADEMDHFRRRVMDVMLKKKSNMQENLEHYRTQGISPTDVWSSVQDTVSRWQNTSARLISYCKPKEKIYQVYNFVSSKVQSLASRWSSNSDDSSKKK